MEKQYKKFTKELLKYLRTYTFHGEYEMTTRWVQDDNDVGINKTVAADITIDNVYLNFTVNLYPILLEDFKNKRFEYITRALTHELCHIYLDPLMTIIEKNETEVTSKYHADIKERQTQRITNALIPGILLDPDYKSLIKKYTYDKKHKSGNRKKKSKKK